MLRPYLTILRRPGALAFTATGLVARMPMAMLGLGLVLLVTGTHGSYGLAGTVTAAYVLAMAIAGPFQARLVDRFGQGRTIPLLALGFAVSTGGLVVAVTSGSPTPLPQAMAVLAGVSYPLVGTYVRARWTHRLRGTPELHTAYALEALLDEVVFMLGPPLVTLLATSIHPVAGVLSALVFGVAGGLAFAALRGTEPPVLRRTSTAAARARLPWATLAPAAAACAGIGVLLGGAEIVVVAVATEQGQRPAAGLLLAGWAAGSMLAALIVGALSLRGSPFTRFRLGLLAMTLTMVPMPFVDNLVLLGGFLFLAGFSVAPTLVASVGIVERSAPESRLSEGIAWTTTGLAAGVAVGAAVVGQVIDGYGGSAGFLVSLVAGVVSTALAFVWLRGSTGRNADALAADRAPRLA